MKTVAIVVGLILSVGGALAAIDSFYARKDWASEQITQLQYQYQSSRLNQVDQQIVQLEQERRRRRLTPIEEDLLRRLYYERRQLVCQLRIERC
jgi:hypothetical protein